MAIQVSFEGFVNEVKVLSWGTVARVSHSQRAKDETTGQWTTVGKDWFDVTLPAGQTVADGALVKVEGTLKVSTFEKKDGTTGIALKVRAQEITPVQGRGSDRQPGNNTQFEAPADWTLTEEAPF